MPKTLSPESCLRLAGRIEQDFALTPVIATEIEFYLNGALPSDDECCARLAEGCARAGLPVERVEKERGTAQFECSLAPLPVAESVNAAQTLKAVLSGSSAEFGAEVEFAAKPHAGEPGSGMHVHVHLADESGTNVFYKKDEAISDALSHALGGLLATMAEGMAAFAPREESYLRFVPGGNAPTTISWGANNRTVALRLPDIGAPYRHIEHRVSGADAEPVAAIAAILAGMHYGLTQRLMPPAQIYGDAGLPQYALPLLPRTLKEARLAAGSGILASYGLVL